MGVRAVVENSKIFLELMAPRLSRAEKKEERKD